MKFEPRPYQREVIEFIRDTPVTDAVRGVAAWVFMGSGKTVCTLTALEHLNLCENVYPALVVAPLRVAATTWPQEAAKWGHLAHLRVSAIVGGLEARKTALRAPADVYTVNPENLPWLLEHLGRRWAYKTVVVDEATMLKSFRLKQGGVRTRALARGLKHRPARVIELTGTPAPNGLQDLWGQVWYLDHGAALGRTHQAFVDRWFRPAYSGYGIEPLPFAQEQIQDAVKHLCLTVDPADHFDIKAPVVVPVYVDLPPAARRHYDEMERMMFTEIAAGEVEAFGAASRTNKCLQIANGALYHLDTEGQPTGKFEVLHDAKIDALRSIVEEANGNPLLVAYHFKSDLKRLRDAFPRAVVLDSAPETINRWNRGEIRMLLAHPQSAGHGLNLQDGGHHLVNFGHTWNLEHRMQILERIGPVRQLQAGHRRPVFVYNIVARNTVDEDVLARTDAKKSVQEVLMDAMNRRKACKTSPTHP